MPARSLLAWHCACLSTLHLVEKYLERAEQLMATQKRDDVEAALAPLDAILELDPECEKALEMKCRALLYLKRFREVVEMLQGLVPSSAMSAISDLGSSSSLFSSFSLFSSISDRLRGPLSVHSLSNQCFSVGTSKHKLTWCKKKRAPERQHWRFLVLGQAYFYLGRMEDAMLLLQCGKRSASIMSQKESICMRDDKFYVEEVSSISSAEADLVSKMLANIKFLMRRRAAAKAALEAGLYTESVRHFSKVIERKRGTPQGFVADCYLHRAMGNRAMGKIMDAIADCNKCLFLCPRCTPALRLRISLHETIDCLSECLLDLQHLKIIYETALRYHESCMLRWQCDEDLEDALLDVNNRIIAVRQKLTKSCSVQAHAVLDVPHECTIEDVEKAFLLLSLKHRTEDACLFLEQWDYLDGRDMAMVKEEARASASRLAHLISKAYHELLSTVSSKREQEKRPLHKDHAVITPKCGAEILHPTVGEGGEESKVNCVELLNNIDMVSKQKKLPVGEGWEESKVNCVEILNNIDMVSKQKKLPVVLEFVGASVAVESEALPACENASADDEGIDPCREGKIAGPRQGLKLAEEMMSGAEEDDLCCLEVCFNMIAHQERALPCLKEGESESLSSSSSKEFDSQEDTVSICLASSSASLSRTSSLTEEEDGRDQMEAQFMDMICSNHKGGCAASGGLSSTILANALSQALFHDSLLSHKATLSRASSWSRLPCTPLPVT